MPGQFMPILNHFPVEINFSLSCRLQQVSWLPFIPDDGVVAADLMGEYFWHFKRLNLHG
jgi:hypothetical protein